MKKIYSTVTYGRIVFALCIALLTAFSSKAQTTLTTVPATTFTGGNSLGAPANIAFVLNNTNGFPVNLTAIGTFCNTTENNSIWQLYYSATSLSGTSTDVTASPWSLIATSLATPVAANGITPLNFPGLNFTIPAGTQLRFVLRNTGPGSTRYSGTGANLTPNSFSGGGVTMLLGDAQIAGQPVGYAGSGIILDGALVPRYFTGFVTFSPAGPCTEPPVPGTLTSTANPVCALTDFTLSLTGGTGGTGQSYQWQSSTNNTDWNDIPTATNATLTRQQTASTYYRVKVTCGTTTVNSASLQVISPSLVSGTFTIDKTQPTGGTNFNSFNDAYNYIKCGIGGPVIFNVVQNTGPYNEQLIMTPVPGASAVNTVTFNGNGNTIAFGSANTDERAVIKLNGADYITFDSLTINATGNTYGFGVHLTNNADFNTVRRSTVISDPSSTSTNYAGLVISAAGNSATATGTTLCDNNTFERNTINGGYYGITLAGGSGNTILNNKVLNNKVNDFYFYGIYCTYNDGALIEKNTISRPTRSTLTTFYGIYFTTGNLGSTISKNRIHSPFTANSLSTSSFNGIYFTGSDATAAAPNKVYNNLIYNNNGSGDVYGIYNSSSDYMECYHNTIALGGDETAATASTLIRAIYQITAATGLNYRNNLVSITKGGLATKNCIYFSTTTSTITSNYNNLYISSPTGTNYTGTWGTATQATLANWQTASSKDANSVAIDPEFIDPNSGFYYPNSATLDNKGTPIAAITTDIQDLARSATTPDIGAYEFAPVACTAPPVPGTLTTTHNPVCINIPFTLGFTGGSFGTGQTYQWQSSPDNSTWTNIPSATNTTLNTSQTATTYYRLMVTCSGQSVPSASIQIVTPNGLIGTYTIDKAQPTGGTNFNSFNAAYSAMSCGISGAVVFNVVPNSGPYNEQLIMGVIPGASAVNTVTFNGNGNTISFLSVNTNERAVIKLNDADHITFDSLIIAATGTTTSEYGYGVQLINNADSNTFRRCQININTSSTSTNFAGIVVSSSATSATSGSALADGNTFDRNTVTGGYYSMTLVGSSTLFNSYNKITRNKFQEYYIYGLYVNGSFQALIDSNTFTRPTRATVTTFYGVYFTGLSASARITRNTITNPFGGNTASTSEANGIYITGSDALPNVENVVSNNLMYNFTGSGDMYGLYNSSSDNVWYLHNTIVVDGPATGNTATDFGVGFYQTTAAAGIQFKNNIVTISRGGLANKYALYFNTLTSDIVSNNNNFFLTSTTGNVNVGFIGGNDQPILANWQAASSQDANSISNDPLYTDIATGNYKPTNVSLDNIGSAQPLVPIDILGAARNATTPDPGAYEFAPPVCVDPPTAGTANVNETPVCENTLVQLGVAGHTTGVGQTYQWQAASAIGGPYANISGVLSNPGFTVTATSTLYYRVAITCGATTVFSAPVLLNVTPGLPGGNYTIDQTQPASSSNFISFNAAKDAMACGITGPVVFDVEPNTGPYLEQVMFDTIPGASASNTVTFNGNGNRIAFSSSNTNERAVIKLTRTDHFTFDSLIVDATGAGTYGFGIQFLNGADSNTIRRCTILANTTSTSTNYTGISISASATSATTTGNTHCDYNTITGNTIIGGYYGITLVGAVATPINNNKLLSNKIRETYLYGIYVAGNNRTTIDGNEISRPTRDNSGTTIYGIYFTGVSTRCVVNANRIHSMFGGMTTTTNDVAGIYFTSVDAVAAELNSVTNNAIYNIASNGYIYGIYNGGSNYVNYFHNTIALDHAASTSTDVARGFYQTTDAEGIDFRQNIVTITRGGTGTKHALYMATAATVYLSNRNDLYVNATNAHIGYDGTNRTTLAAWQTASSQDANSVNFDPQFTNPISGNLRPQLAALDNLGLPLVPPVLNDITGAVRSLTTPDIGAFEFAITPCTAPPVAGTAIATPSSNVCLGDIVTLNLTGNSTGGFQTYRWQRGPSATGPWTDISGELFSPEYNHTLASQDSWFRCVVTCSGNSQNSTSVQVVLNPLLLAGDYTIDPAIPPSATNFQSFATAVAALECGITGSVRFHTVPGTYTEQIRIPFVPGTSPTSTVTFLSQNGNPASVTLTFNATAANNYTLKLDSANHIIFKNMTIAASNSTNGRAIELAGTASSDSILNCVINVPSVSSTSTNIAGIFANAITGSDNVIKGNTLTNGGAGAIHLTGTTTVSNRFVIDSNTVTGAYNYGIYAANLDQVKMNRNTVDRSGVLNTSAYGLYLSNCDSGYQVNNNKVNIANTGVTVYGIYLTGCQSRFGLPGSVSNNKVIGGAGNTGNQYGIYITTSTMANSRNNAIVTNTSGATSYGAYITGTGGINFQNNSVLSTATSATNNIVAYFSQTSGANGAVNIRNNIFSHEGGGRAMHIVNPQFIYSDYNMFFSTGATLVQWGTALNLATLQAWRDTSYWDFNSIRYKPAFTSATDVTPDAASPDVWAIHGRGVQIDDNNSDINGNARPTTLTAGVPDLGAYEFLPTSVPVLLTATPAAPVANSTQTFMLGTDTVAKITWGANVPTTVTGKRYSGVQPPGLATGQDYMYFYTDFDITGTTPTGHSIKQFYIDPWRGFIGSEAVIKLGRTDAANAWQVSTASTVNIYDNVISENNLNILDKYTGLTDGSAAPIPPIVVSPSDSSNRGRMFWVGYGHHQDFGSGNAQQMVLYLGAGSTPAVATVRINGTQWVKTYNIPANTVISSDFLPKYGLFDARLLAEGLSDKAISIESNVPITAYAHIYGNTNSGATMLIPVGAYGFEYYAITSKQNYANNTYSWVNVIAPYDSTVVEITPSKPTLNGRPAGVPFTVTLKRGEVYQVLGAIISGSDGYDLTGTKIKSIANQNGKCFPVAVFSGSSRTNIGCGSSTPSASGDNIIQQNFPYRAWGRKYLTAPSSQQATPSANNTNIYKISVKDPTTIVSKNGIPFNPATDLIDNLYYQYESSTADYIEADKPIMVAQFMPSSSGSGCTWVGTGDPEMIYISPVEQGIKNVALYRNTAFSITTQYLTLIIPAGGIPSLRIDGSATWDHIYDHPNRPGYKVVVRRWSPATIGQTFVSSDTAFTAITYGYGSAESYGYNAGTLINNLNVFPTIANVYNTSGNPNDYTCVGTPFTVSFLSTVQPTTIEWLFSQVPNITPNTNVVQNNPTPAATVVINGVTYYRYTLPTQYVASTVGVLNVPIYITHPDVEGCNNRMQSSIPINVVGAPDADFALPVPACPNIAAPFNGTVSGNASPVATWSWNFNPGTGTGQNTTFTFPSVGTYNVSVSIIGTEGCVDTTTKAVVIGNGPVVNIVPDSLGVCPGDNATFTVQNPVAGATYSWFSGPTGGSAVATGTSFTINNITAPVSYYVESSLNGCVSTTRKRVQVTVRPALATPVAIVDSVGTDLIRFRWSAVVGATGYEVTTNGGTSWVTPSSGSTGLTHTVTGLQVGQSVTLQVRALGGCLPATSQAVTGQTVTDQIYIPNAFTPNGDGLNDQLRVYSNVIRTMRFAVFNQWGEKIFESTSQANAWDGTYKNKQQPSGVYMYVCDITLVDGTRVQRKGAINLVR